MPTAARRKRFGISERHDSGAIGPDKSGPQWKQTLLEMGHRDRLRSQAAGDPRIYEKTTAALGYTTIAGIDEAGRGPLAGPVVSAAVILPLTFSNPEITDSKKLSAVRRRRLYDLIYEHAVAIGIGLVDAGEIDRINILQASLQSMTMAVSNLDPRPDCLLIDGTFPISLSTHQVTIPKGDALSISISAASIVAKVTRDRLMERYDLDYPQYRFTTHKGYPTKAHREAIRRYGCCPIHRRSFKGVAGHVRPATHQQLPLGTDHAESKTKIR